MKIFAAKYLQINFESCNRFYGSKATEAINKVSDNSGQILWTIPEKIQTGD